MSEELRPYVREYGSGDDRWAWHRSQFTAKLWDLLCDGHGAEFTLAEYQTEAEAWKALARACDRAANAMPATKAAPSSSVYRPQRSIYIHVSGMYGPALPDTRTLQEVLRVPRERRTKRDVMRLRDEAAIFGGCCDRFADNMGCDCLERARD